MTYFDIFNSAVTVIVFILTGWVTINLVLHHRSWFLILFFGVFAEASLVGILALFFTMPEWIWLLRVVNSLVWIGAFVGLIYESNRTRG